MNSPLCSCDFMNLRSTPSLVSRPEHFNVEFACFNRKFYSNSFLFRTYRLRKTLSIHGFLINYDLKNKHISLNHACPSYVYSISPHSPFRPTQFSVFCCLFQGRYA